MDLKSDSSHFFSQFYEMSYSFLRGALEFRLKESTKQVMKGTEPPKTPVPFVYYRGSREKGILFGGISKYLIHESVIRVFKENQFTGWDTFPIEAYDKSNKKLEGYYGLFVKGRCGKIIDSWSPIEERPSPAGFMRPVKVGLYFEPDSWDGSDIFSPDGTTAIFVTKRVKETIERLKINTVIFENITETTRIYTIKN